MKIICVGQNYLEHIKELSNVKSKEPLVFLKPDTALISKGRSFFIPNFSKDIHYELEVVIKIKKPEIKRINNFFFHDKRIVQLLKENGMTKWTIYKTEDVEPLKVIAICEYKNDESFQKCQKVFLKFLPKIRDLIIKTNFARAHVVEDVI